MSLRLQVAPERLGGGRVSRGSNRENEAEDSSRPAAPLQSGWIVVSCCTVIFVMFAAALRMAPHSPFYPVPGDYRAYSFYDIRHILQTGHEIKLSEHHDVTSYSSGIYLGTDDVLRHKVDASVMLLMGLNTSDLEAYYHFGLWSPLVAFPLSILALYFALCRFNGRAARKIDVLVLLLFSLVGSFMMLEVSYHGETNTTTGWTFMAVAMYGLLRIKDAPFTGRLLFFLFSGLVVLLYHTAALVLASAVVSIGIFELFRLRSWNRYSHSAITMLAVGIFVVWYFMYVSLSFFDLFAQSLGHVPQLVSYLLREQSGAVPRDFALQDLLSHGNSSFVDPLIALSLLVALPVMTFVVLGVLRRLERYVGERGKGVVFPWLLGLLPFAIALFIWSGFGGVQGKEGEFGSLFAVFAIAAFLAGRVPGLARTVLLILVILCSGLSSYLYFNFEKNGPSHLTYPEEHAALWLAARAPQDQTVFTDLRLAAPLIEANHLAVEGIDDYQDPRLVRNELMAIYYGHNPQLVWPALRAIPVAPHTALGYALFSRRASDNLPGIKGYDYNFKGAPPNFLDKFRQLPGFNLLYDNGTVQIFKLSDPRLGVSSGH